MKLFHFHTSLFHLQPIPPGSCFFLPPHPNDGRQLFAILPVGRRRGRPKSQWETLASWKSKPPLSPFHVVSTEISSI